MPSLIRLSGPYGYFLAFLSVVVLFLALRATRAILRGSASTPGVVKEHLNALLFWGGVAAILGLLGQFDGSYRALSQILQASEISPDVVAEGFVISFVPTLFGLGILGFAVAAWGCLHLLVSSKPPGGKAVPLVLLALPILWSCTEDVPSPEAVSLGDGVWSLTAENDEFLWEFTHADDTLSCVVHNLVGKMTNGRWPLEREGVSIPRQVSSVLPSPIGRRRSWEEKRRPSSRPEPKGGRPVVPTAEGTTSAPREKKE